MQVIKVMMGEAGDGWNLVSELSGYVANQTSYLHKTSNLNDTITRLAQSSVGTNNVPLLTGL